MKVPVIASLNGTTAESWLNFATPLEEAGADGLEVNYYEVMTISRCRAPPSSASIRDVIAELKRVLKIPVAVKLSPFFTAFGNIARQLDAAGADGLVLFNRFYQPDIDVRARGGRTRISSSREAPNCCCASGGWPSCTAASAPRSPAPAASRLPADGIKAILAGAHVVQIVSAILRYGPSYLVVMRDGLAHWMESHGCNTLDEVRGRVSLQQSAENPSAFERANYIRTLQSWNPT